MPTTRIDLTSSDVVADPYPHFAEERRSHAVAWHEPSGMWLTFDHASANAVLRHRRLGRIWVDKQPEGRFEPFNLLHRNQMMENEPPEHTRLRRLVAGAFARGHVERLRPRVRALAGQLLDEVDPADFDVIGEYAEPLPVLVIAELLGVPTELAPQLRSWSQAIVRMYEVAPTATDQDAAVTAARDFAEMVRELARDRAAAPRDDLVSDLVAARVSEGRDATVRLSEDEVVASAVLLLNAGHEASVNVFGNGLVAMLSRGLQPGTGRVPECVEEMLRFDSALQLFERTATADVRIGDVTVEKGQKVAALLGAANRDPAVFDRADTFVPTRDPNPHLAFGAGVHFCLGAPLARMELAESLGLLWSRMPGLDLVADPTPRGTFVLRGYRSVRVGSPGPHNASHPQHPHQGESHS